MKLSTRSRYGLRFLVELASRERSTPVYLGEIAKRQNISEKYLSKLVIPLRSSKLINSERGSHGGYMLARDPSGITVREIVESLEGDICPVDCVRDETLCERAAECAAREVWCGLNRQIHDFLENITLESVVRDYRDKLGKKRDYVYYI